MRNVILMGVVALLFTAGTAQAQMFTNGDFETGDWTGWTVRATENGTTGVQDVVLWDIDGDGPLDESLAGYLSVGKIDYYDVDAGMEMVQSLSLASGVEYTFGANLAIFMNDDYYGQADGGLFELIAGDSVLASWDSGSLDPMEERFYELSGNFTPDTTDDYEVGLRITRRYTVSSYLEEYIDNVTGVPEPATLALLVLGGLAALRRR